MILEYCPKNDIFLYKQVGAKGEFCVKGIVTIK